MSNYSSNESHCRVDIFKRDGFKWVETIMLDWSKKYEAPLIHSAFKELMEEQYPERFIGCRAVCLEPFHSHSFPIIIQL